MQQINLFLQRLFLTFLMLFMVVTVFAQLNYITDDTIKIDEIVVTGTPVKVSRNNVPMAVSVVNRGQIEETDESAILPILNGRVPGLFVTERGVTGFGVAQGSAGQISIRGIGGNPTTGILMLIDGHPQFMGIMGHPLPDSYVASDVERVEVIRGPASILYGSNAMGGVINIITKKQVRPGLHGNARVMYGSFNTQKYMASAGIKKNRFSSFISANHDKTDGHRPNSDFKINNGYVKLGYDFNSNFYASTDVSIAAFEAADPGPDRADASPGQRIDIMRGYWSFTLQNEFDKASGSLKAFYNFGEHEITDGFHSNDFSYGLNFFESVKLFKGNNITLGLDYMNYGGLAENTQAMGGKGIQFADTAINETGVYGFVQQTIAEKIILNGGMRFQNNSIYGNQWIPSVGFAFNINQETTWKGNVSKGFRSPTMRELFMWGPNSNLNPETIVSYETGLSRSFFDKRMSAELTFFVIDGDNLIVNVGPPNGYLNSGEVSNKGLELQVNAEASENLRFNATYAYINMKNPVFATPEHHLFLNAHYKLKKLLLNANIQQVSNLDNDVTAGVNFVSYSVLNAKASYQVSKAVKVFVSGENLLNQEYEVNRFYTMPGATVFSGINFQF